MSYSDLLVDGFADRYPRDQVRIILYLDSRYTTHDRPDCPQAHVLRVMDRRYALLPLTEALYPEDPCSHCMPGTGALNDIRAANALSVALAEYSCGGEAGAVRRDVAARARFAPPSLRAWLPQPDVSAIGAPSKGPWIVGLLARHETAGSYPWGRTCRLLDRAGLRVDRLESTVVALLPELHHEALDEDLRVAGPFEGVPTAEVLDLVGAFVEDDGLGMSAATELAFAVLSDARI